MYTLNWKFALLCSVLFLLTAACGDANSVKSVEANTNSDTQQTDPKAKTLAPDLGNKKEKKGPLKVASLFENCQEFHTKLANAEPYSCTYAHPITKEKMKREIKGMVDGKCLYEEQMPNNGLMVCKYSKKQLKSVSEYYAKMMFGESYQTKAKIGFGEKVETEEKVDGKTVDNPLMRAMNDGTCVVLGYD